MNVFHRICTPSGRGVCRLDRCRRRGRPPSRLQAIGNLAKGLEIGHFIGGDGWEIRQPIFKSREDFHPFDGIDAQIGFHIHV